MNVHESVKPKFVRIEELAGIITESTDQNHAIARDKIELVQEATDEGLKIFSELMSPKMAGRYDLEAGQWLVTHRIIFKEAKGDLTLPWNQLTEEDKRNSEAQLQQDCMELCAEHGISADTSSEEPSKAPDFDGFLQARRELKESKRKEGRRKDV